ncbi:MAG: TIR domain-containing protein [Pikeienuella sp.]
MEIKSSKPRVFLLHARADADAAQAPAQSLRDRGAEPWLAEEQVGPGENVTERVGATIETSIARAFAKP